jgi:hypothetical protein
VTTPRVGIPIAFALLLACAVPASSAANHPDFAGRWLLNKDRSDALGGAGVNGPLMGGRGVDPVLRERMRALARLAFDAPAELVVSAQGDVVRLVDDEGHVTELKADGSKVEEPAGGMTLQRRTRWEKDRLLTEVKAKDGGGEVKQVYSRDGDRLVIESTFEGEVAAKNEKMRFVYDLKP